MKKTFVLLVVAALVIIATGMAVFTATPYPMLKVQAEARKIPMHEVELARVKDGIYCGDFTYGNFTHRVEVVVEDHERQESNIIKNQSEDEQVKKPRVSWTKRSKLSL